MAIGTRFPTFIEVGTSAAIALATAGAAVLYIEGEQRVTGVLSGSGTVLFESGAYIDGSTLVVTANNNRVGVGTVSPDTALDVVGTLSGSALSIQGELDIASGATFDTSTLYVNAGTNRVGVVNTAPKTALEVIGTVSGATIKGDTVSGAILRIRTTQNGVLCVTSGGLVGFCSNQPGTGGDCTCSTP